MFPVLRTFGRSVTQSQSYSKPLSNPNEINVTFAFLARSIGHKSSKGRIGIRRSKLSPATEASSDGPVGGRLLKPALFTVATCTGAFAAAAVYKYEDFVNEQDRKIKEHQSFSEKLNRFIEGSGLEKSEWREWASRYWSRFSTGEKMAVGCIWINMCVYAGWRVNNPAVARFMHRYFTSNVNGEAPCLSMLLSTFSHTNLTHLAVNMICLWSFAPTVVNLLGKEQATALYISAGMSSAMAGYILNVVRASTAVSVGASGAILGFAGAVCTKYPDAKLAIIFLPMFPIAAKYALGGLVGLDVAGVLLRWKLFDHAGHLGGILFGIGYVLMGHQYILRFQKEVLRWWDEYR